MRLLRLLAALLLAGLGNTGRATNVVEAVDRLSPDFVKVSLLWIGPGKSLISCFGHVSLRLECPAYQLDYCFSTENEPICGNFTRFATGRLKAGLFAIPTRNFLQDYGQSGRWCRQYKLDLPADVKQRLWKILDDCVSAGRSYPYDYIRHSCVQTMLKPLLEAVRPRQLVVAPWDIVYSLPQREMLAKDLSWCPWRRFFLQTIIGTEVDRKVCAFSEVLHPQEMVELLRGATIDGKPVLSGQGELLLPYGLSTAPFFLSPVVFGIILLFVALLNIYKLNIAIEWIFLILQTAIGLLVTYLVLFSSLPATDWNWLLVPFNLLPILFWKFRSQWALAFCVVLLVWENYMLFSPMQRTDPAYYLIVLAYLVFYATIGIRRCQSLFNHS